MRVATGQKYARKVLKVSLLSVDRDIMEDVEFMIMSRNCVA